MEEEEKRKMFDNMMLFGMSITHINYEGIVKEVTEEFVDFSDCDVCQK